MSHSLMPYFCKMLNQLSSSFWEWHRIVTFFLELRYLDMDPNNIEWLLHFLITHPGRQSLYCSSMLNSCLLNDRHVEACDSSVRSAVSALVRDCFRTVAVPRNKRSCVRELVVSNHRLIMLISCYAQGAGCQVGTNQQMRNGTRQPRPRCWQSSVSGFDGAAEWHAELWEDLWHASCNLLLQNPTTRYVKRISLYVIVCSDNILETSLIAWNAFNMLDIEDLWYYF